MNLSNLSTLELVEYAEQASTEPTHELLKQLRIAYKACVADGADRAIFKRVEQAGIRIKRELQQAKRLPKAIFMEQAKERATKMEAIRQAAMKQGKTIKVQL